jgi:hypothetical protein
MRTGSESPGGLQGTPRRSARRCHRFHPNTAAAQLRSGHFTKIDIDNLPSRSEAIQAMASRQVSSYIVIVSDAKLQ